MKGPLTVTTRISKLGLDSTKKSGSASNDDWNSQISCRVMHRRAPDIVARVVKLGTGSSNRAVSRVHK